MKRTRFNTLLAAAGFLIVTNAQADTLGGRIGINLWQQGFEGDVRSGGGRIDLEDDLNYNNDTRQGYYLQLEHPVPLLPNIKLEYQNLRDSGFGFVDGIEFDGVEYTGDVQSSLDLTHTDFTFYYEVLDNWVNLDLGVTGRRFDDRSMTINNFDPAASGAIDIDYVLPMLYGHARFDLPFSGLSVGIEGNYTSYDDDTLYDTKLNFGYTFDFGLGIEAGYRVMDFEFEDGRESVDVTIDGVYGGLFWDF